MGCGEMYLFNLFFPLALYIMIKEMINKNVPSHDMQYRVSSVNYIYLLNVICSYISFLDDV